MKKRRKAGEYPSKRQFYIDALKDKTKKTLGEKMNGAED